MSITPAAPAPAKPSGHASPDPASITLAQVKADPEVLVLISAANENLGVIGYTDHGFRHAEIVARDARVILRRTGYSLREQDLARPDVALAGVARELGREMALSRRMFFLLLELRQGYREGIRNNIVYLEMMVNNLRAEIVAYDDLIRLGSYAAARAAGAFRLEGREYTMADGDIVNFRFSPPR